MLVNACWSWHLGPPENYLTSTEVKAMFLFGQWRVEWWMQDAGDLEKQDVAQRAVWVIKN